jgi:enterochelin esterase-like enzyme
MIKRFENFKSDYVEKRNIDVWLPDNYDPKEKYSVLYMNDGQMLFDSAITWNKQEWQVDETIQRLINENKIKKSIVVGIWNGGAARHIEFCPQKPFESLPKNYRDSIIKAATRLNGNSVFSGNVVSDNYLKFIVKELKPFIDENFSTRKTRNHTFIGGSSMGGLISLYAICEYPDVFGGALCMSTHWPVIFSAENNPFPTAIDQYLKKNLPNPRNHKLYFDYGTKTLDSMYKPFQTTIDEIMIKKGYNSNNFKSIEFCGDDHSEKSWSKRLNIPIEFLLYCQ